MNPASPPRRLPALPRKWGDDGSGILKAQYTISQEHVKLATNRPVRVQELTVTGDVTPHDHDYYEICIIRSGNALHLTDAYQEPLRPGSIVIVPPGKVHAFTGSKGLAVTNIYYLAEWLLVDLRSLWETDGLVPLFLAASLFRRAEETRVPQFHLARAEYSACMQELNDTAKELAREQPSIVFAKSSFLKFLILVSRAWVAQQSRELGFSFRKEIWQALDHIEECISECVPLNVDELGAKLHLSTDHMSKVFKQATGFAPLEYFQRRRIHHACQLLLNPRNSITEVGLTLGYADTAHLSRFFTRYVGLSPRAYRKRYGAAQASRKPESEPRV